MKLKTRAVGISILLGLFTSVINSIANYFVSDEKSFWDLLLFDVPLFEIYVRAIIMIVFIISGFIFSNIMVKRGKAEQRLKKITSSTNDAIIQIDGKAKITFWNRSAEQIFGFSSGEVFGKKLHNLIAPERYLEDFNRGFKEFTKTGQGAAIGKTIELAAVRKDGTEFEIELSLAAYMEDREWQAVGIVRDISKRKNAEREKEKLISDLQNAMAEIKQLNGLVPICQHCKNIRDDTGYWNRIESYVSLSSDADLSHGICPDCAEKYYPDMSLYDD